jgi:hypothetical protein
MLGHHVSDEVFNLLKTQNKIYLAQHEGKLAIKKVEEPAVAIVLKKTDDCVSKLELEERTELNNSKILFVTVGSSKNISEVFIPNEYFENAKYEGRPFLHGIFDCYTLIRDYYKREFNIFLPTNMQRNWDWWSHGENLYVDNAKYHGFEEVADIKKHDVLVMKIGSPVPNHGAIYLGNNKILHHAAGRFSTIQTLTNSYKQKISVIYRNKSLQNAN